MGFGTSNWVIGEWPKARVSIEPVLGKLERTNPYSGTKTILVVAPSLARERITLFQVLSKHSFSSLKTGFVGSGHCEAWVVPILAWIW
jgi:hypothetical protein